jgi:preprotein translocase subunit SecF
MSRVGSLGHRLYTGEVSYDFIGKAKLWYAISAALMLLSLITILGLKLDLGIEFRGGAQLQVQTAEADVDRAREAMEPLGLGEIRVVKVGGDEIRVETPEITDEKKTQARDALAEEFGVQPSAVSAQVIGPSWGDDISGKALRGLIVFLVLVVLFMSLYFEWKMALAGIVALLHDLVITVGIYALTGFTVTPATVIGLLTILGYSLYDTVVVFDKVKENTTGLQASGRLSYSQAANLAVNQTLVRSINTSIIALLPVGAILFVGAGLLHAETLKDLSLALFVGIAAGTYSSVFIATPLAAQLKEREPAMQALARRVAVRQGGGGVGPAGTPAARAAKRAAGGSGGSTAMLVREDAAPGGLVTDADVDVAEAQGAEAKDIAAQDIAAQRGAVQPRPGKRPPAARTGSTAAGGRPQPRKSSSGKGRPSGKKRR